MAWSHLHAVRPNGWSRSGELSAETVVVENGTENATMQSDLALWILVGLALVLIGLPVYSLIIGAL